MELAYRYHALDSRNKPVSGLVYAQGADLAYAKLKRNGFRPTQVSVSLPSSLRNVVAPGFDGRDLARFYRTLGRRLLNGRSIDEGLLSASQFVRDEKLKQAALMMRQAILDGRRENEAMLFAGFARRDAMVIRAAEKSGRAGEMFLSLAQEVERTSTLRGSVKALFRMPLIMMLTMYGFFFVVIHWITPRTMVFLANIGAKLPAFNERYFAFAQAFNDHLALATLLYAAFPLALLLFLRSHAFARLLDGVRTLREISVKADYASLWTGFALLYDAAIPPMEAARTMKEAAEREDSRLAFARLEKLLYTGIYLESAVERAGFPLFVADGVRAATTGGNIVEGLRDMTNDLSEDVFNLTQRLRENLTLVSLLILAAAVVLFFFLSYYPMISVAMKNV